ncbi:D-alanyl-D-alanine carboxypeptidase family protein [Ammoniphilus resinae]|uniref:serine-type D-Ala-D-Ala carboxypeptidase n=1 Tax=Ammoniphilus resinae TaxID=861532 RepID=A0ABS4GTB8_9BACL|nr:D-alanyl-D-alanine carboxypeptidase family protein [Ammoniphilus resinae]MBP1933529.1 D-alanyl-D-alanine carboxypeptidase (penicillin-binding protein 5/6) [Ammoniphilus resinae]
MQKKVAFLLALMLCLSPAVSLAEENAQVHLAANAKSAILLDVDTGTVIYEKNAHEKLPPASITKVMTMLLIMEALERGEIKLSDKVRTSEYAASMGGSQIFLEPGEMMSVEEMLKGIAVASGNDASVAMAEHLAGTEEAFIKKMNERAKELGLQNTHFVNTNGLPAENHYSSAHDIALMSRELLKHEEITKYTSIYQDYLRKDSNRPFWLVNTNKLVRFYPGADGLKTGYTAEAKYCLSATAKKDNMRVVAVVMGEPNSKTRNSEITQMFDYAFASYQSHPFVKKGEAITKIEINKGSLSEMNLTAPHHFGILTKKGESINDYEKEIVVNPMVDAPIKQGEILGHMFVKKNGKEVARLDLVAEQSVSKATWWELMKRSTKRMILGLE